MLGKERAYQARHHAQGLCRSCPRKLTLYRWRCNQCEMKHRALQRRRRGSKAWKPGMKGGIPRGERLLSIVGDVG